MHRFLLVFVSFVVISGVSCKQDSEPVRQGDIRVISLSPGISNTVIESGFEQFLVGRSPFCYEASDALTVVGDLRNIDYERLLKLAPTHVFVQETTSGLDEHLSKLSSMHNFELRAWPLNRLSEIALLQGDITEMFGSERKRFEIEFEINEPKYASVLVMTQGSSGSAGLCFGTETYIDDILKKMGIQNVLEQPGWISLSLEDIGRLQPEAILVVSDSEIFEGSLANVGTLGIRVIPFRHRHVLVPSSSIVDVASELHNILSKP